MNHELSTDQQIDNLARFGSAASRSFGSVRMLPTGEGPFKGTARTLDAGAVRVADIRSTAIRVERPTSVIGVHDVDLHKIASVQRGRGVLVQDGRDVAFASGDLILYDTSRPYQLVMPEASELLVVGVPYRMTRATAHVGRGFTATRFDGTAGVGGMVSGFLTSLRGEFGSLDQQRSGHRLGAVLGQLFELLLVDVEDRADETISPMLRRVLDYCDEHLPDPELTVPALAAAHGMSARYLYKLFAPMGVAPATYVRQRRIAAIHAALLDPAQSSVAISTIAARHGMVDAPHFTRLFRQEYGCSPSEHRRRNGPGASVLT